MISLYVALTVMLVVLLMVELQAAFDFQRSAGRRTLAALFIAAFIGWTGYHGWVVTGALHTSVAGIRVGTPQTNVEAILGQGRPSEVADGTLVPSTAIHEYQGGVSVQYGPKDTASRVWVTSTRYTGPGGIAVGDAVQEVLTRCGSPARRGGNWALYWLPWRVGAWIFDWGGKPPYPRVTRICLAENWSPNGDLAFVAMFLPLGLACGKFVLDWNNRRIWKPCDFALNLLLVALLAPMSALSRDLWWKLGDTLADLGLVRPAESVYRASIEKKRSIRYCQARLEQLSGMVPARTQSGSSAPAPADP